MTLKRKALDAEAFAQVAVPQPDPVQIAAGVLRARNARAPSRVNKVQIQGYFWPDTRRSLKMLAAKEGRTVEELLGEAIEDLLRKHRCA